MLGCRGSRNRLGEGVMSSYEVVQRKLSHTLPSRSLCRWRDSPAPVR
jgi:hypothetical protein